MHCKFHFWTFKNQTNRKKIILPWIKNILFRFIFTFENAEKDTHTHSHTYFLPLKHVITWFESFILL